MLAEIQKDAKDRMQKSIESLEFAFSKIRTGRAHPSILDSVRVDYYGSEVPISQVANINIEDARTLAVQPWESNMLSAIEKAIMTSDLGINPVTAGNVMRLPMPMLTEERRKEFVKVARADAEQARVAIRNIRRDANTQVKDLLKDKEISEDDAKRSDDAVQKITDDFISQVDKLLSAKEDSLLEI